MERVEGKVGGRVERMSDQDDDLVRAFEAAELRVYAGVTGGETNARGASGACEPVTEVPGAVTDSTLVDLVRRALRNGADNGYDDDEMLDAELAVDLREYDADIEPYPLDEIEQAVAVVRAEQ